MGVAEAVERLRLLDGVDRAAAQSAQAARTGGRSRERGCACAANGCSARLCIPRLCRHDRDGQAADGRPGRDGKKPVSLLTQNIKVGPVNPVSLVF